jgi:hypothetical protein
VADGRNQKVRIFDRTSMVELTNFGKGGHYPGEWYSLQQTLRSIRRATSTPWRPIRAAGCERFLYKGLAPVTRAQQGVVWPSTR